MKILGENCNIFGNNAILRYYDLIMFSATFFAEKGYFFRQWLSNKVQVSKNAKGG